MPATRPSPDAKPRRTHTFGGCRTCKRRHTKCDRVRPFCLTCRTAGVGCEGYSTGIQWLPPSTPSRLGLVDADKTTRQETRRPLYTEEFRASMSAALTTNLPPSSVDSYLAELDNRTIDHCSSTADVLNQGPFGVILGLGVNTQEPQGVGPGDPIDLTTNESNLSGEGMGSVPGPSADSFLDSIDTFGSIDTFDSDLGLNNTLEWADLFDLNFGNIMMAPHFGEGTDLAFLDDGYVTATTGGPDRSIPIPEDMPPQFSGDTSQQGQQSQTTSEIERNPISLSEVNSVAEVQFLLRHFQDSVINQMSFIPASSKSPWRILNLPHAVRTLADMTYLDSGMIKHANAANLYSLLACSAYHLSANPALHPSTPTEYWENIVNRTREKAKVHMQFSVRQELEGRGKAKYKDQLMAILAMLALASISGHHKDARCYLLDAERLLRVRGLAQQTISRKARLLHHVYTWIRIVGESTYVLHNFEKYGSVIRSMGQRHSAGSAKEGASNSQREKETTTRSNHNALLDDFLRLDTHPSDSDLDIEGTKEAEVGLHDIHLEDSRQFAATLFQVYGISETWLSLVSQTTRLANVLDARKHSKDTDARFSELIQKRVDRLENMVCAFSQKTESRSASVHSTNEDGIGEETPPGRRRPSYHMYRAFNSALVLLFYRRIRNVNSLILQGYVDHVIEALHEFDAALLSYGAEGPGTAWPAFIAGCEARSQAQRDFLLAWVEKGLAKCGLFSFRSARDVMQEAWKKPSKGWVDISKEQKIWVMLF